MVAPRLAPTRGATTMDGLATSWHGSGTHKGCQVLHAKSGAHPVSDWKNHILSPGTLMRAKSRETLSILSYSTLTRIDSTAIVTSDTLVRFYTEVAEKQRSFCI